MRLLLRLIVLMAVVSAAGTAGYRPAVEYWRERSRPKFQTVAVERGPVIEVINATGTVEPVLTVHVGAFVSGPIVELNVDFNDEVKKGDVLAKIDPRIYQANVARDEANLATRRAEVQRIQARLQNAMNDERRSVALRADNADYISDTEMDQFKFARMALEAELLVAEASIKQAQASLDNSVANLNYTEITAPVDGIVINRLIDSGQTLASQFQTPELFEIAPDMRKEMYVRATVDEVEIGRIREAAAAGKLVQFSVGAYPDELFEGKILQIRLSSTTTDNVVTYPVIISAPNPELRLLPDMTAEISFEIEQKADVIKIPNSALRFYPMRDHVREEDRPILDGTQETVDDGQSASVPSAREKVDAGRNRRRHVWIAERGILRAIEVVTGITDWKFTELVSGDLDVGQALVTGLKTE